MQQGKKLPTYVLPVVIILLIVGAVAAFWFGFGKQDTPAVEDVPAEEQFFALEANSDETPAPSATADPGVVAYVSGAVLNPDVYRLPAEARVKDLILAAGGLTPDAAAEAINLAERLKDSEHIHVPRRGEAAQPTGDQTSASSASSLIDINRASAAELDTLPGIGETLAQRIVDYRAANGPFTSVEDLGEVDGVSASVVAKLAPLVTIGP